MSRIVPVAPRENDVVPQVSTSLANGDGGAPSGACASLLLPSQI